MERIIGDDVDPLWRQRGSLAVVSIARGPDLTRNGVQVYADGVA